MEQRSGIARKVRHTTHVASTGGYHGHQHYAAPVISTSHTAVLTLDDAAVELSPGGLVHLEEGDEVRLLGRVRNDGVFEANGYHNVTKNVTALRSDWTSMQSLWGAVVVAALLVCEGVYLFRHAFPAGPVSWPLAIMASAGVAGLGIAKVIGISRERHALFRELRNGTLPLGRIGSIPPHGFQAAKQ